MGRLLALVLLLPLAAAGAASTDPVGDVWFDLGILEPLASEFRCTDDRLDLVAVAIVEDAGAVRFVATVVDPHAASACEVASAASVPMAASPWVEFEFEDVGAWVRVAPYPGGGYAFDLDVGGVYAEVLVPDAAVVGNSYVVSVPRVVEAIGPGAEPLLVDITTLEWPAGKVTMQAREHPVVGGYNTMTFFAEDRAWLDAPVFG